MRRFVVNLAGTAVVVMLIVGPVAFAFQLRGQTRNFQVVREGVLYRSGQMSLAGLKRIVHEHGIRTVVTLRDAYVPGEPPPDLEEEEFCRQQEINHVRIPPAQWEGKEGEPPPVEPGVRKFREVMSDPANYPVLVHCFAGVHRTGAYCAIYRMEFEHWSNARAIAEMKRLGYVNLDDEFDVLGYLEQYRPTWKEDEEKPAAAPRKKKKKAPKNLTRGRKGSPRPEGPGTP